MLEPTSKISSTTVAPAPFNQLSADITLRTPDLVDFHVHSQILSQASPIFADMLSLPQPPSPSVARPLIDVSEDSKTLENLMRLCYPIAKPKVTELADLGSLLEAAAKYEMMGPPTLVIPDLLDFAAQDPFKVWAIACRFGPALEPAAQCAVARMVEMSKDHYRQQQNTWQPQVPFPTQRLLDELLSKDGVDTLRGISAGDYYRLVEHIRAQRPGQELKIQSHQPLLAARPSGPSEPTLDAPSPEQFIPRLSPPDVEVQCADGTRHRAHIVVLGMHSCTLQERIRAALAAAHEYDTPSSGQVDDSEPPLPVLKLDIDSPTLTMLLALCYVGCAGNLPPDPDPRLLISTLIAARTLGMESVVEAATGLWNRAVDASPLDAYFIAAERGQHDLAASAARKALEGPVVGVYARSMETCPALAYHRLLAYYTECAEAARDAVKGEVEQAKNNMNIMYVDDVSNNSYYNRKEPRLRLVHRSQLGKQLLTSESSSEVLTGHSLSLCYASSVQLSSGSVFSWQASSYAEASVRLFDSLPQAITDAVEKASSLFAAETK